MTIIRDELKRFLSANFLFGQEMNLQDNDSFLEAGIIDSTGVLELVDFVEETFALKMKDSDLTTQNLDSLAGLVAFIESRLHSRKAEHNAG